MRKIELKKEFYKVIKARLKKEMILFDDFQKENDGEFYLEKDEVYYVRIYDYDKMREMGYKFSIPDEIYIPNKKKWVDFILCDDEKYSDLFEEILIWFIGEWRNFLI